MVMKIQRRSSLGFRHYVPMPLRAVVTTRLALLEPTSPYVRQRRAAAKRVRTSPSGIRLDLSGNRMGNSTRRGMLGLALGPAELLHRGKARRRPTSRTQTRARRRVRRRAPVRARSNGLERRPTREPIRWGSFFACSQRSTGGMLLFARFWTVISREYRQCKFGFRARDTSEFCDASGKYPPGRLAMCRVYVCSHHCPQPRE